MNKLLSNFEKKEVCVICNKKTEENKNNHINSRFYYVECAGQLCKECYGEIYNVKNQ